MFAATWISLKSSLMLYEVRVQLKCESGPRKPTMSRKDSNRVWREDILGIRSEEQKIDTSKNKSLLNASPATVTAKTLKRLQTNIMLFVMFANVCLASNGHSFNVSGQTNFSAHKIMMFTTSLKAEYHMQLYEPHHKRWNVYLGGKVNPDFDIFGKDFKTNVFATLGIDF